MKANIPKGAEYEIRTERAKATNVNFGGNKFERIDSADQITQTVRLLYEGKLSTATSSKPGSEEELIQKACEMVKFGSPYDVPFVGKTEISSLDLVDNSSMSSKEMIDTMHGFVEDVRSLDERLTVSARLSSGLNEVSLKTSSGFDAGYDKSMWSWGGAVSLMQGDDLLQIWEAKRGKGPDFDLKKLKEDIGQKLEYAKNVVEMEAGTYPVIFTPSEVGYIINPVLQSLNGLAVHRKVSPWSDKLGQVMLDERFTLVDDCTAKGEWTSIPFDLEGTPTRKNVLVDKGKLGDLLTNRKVAAQLGRQSSGNAGPNGPAPNFVTLPSGRKTLEELISSIDYGLIIDGTMGAWSGNPFSGIVTGTISMGLKIEKGKIAGRVKDCMFTVNTFEHFNKHLIDFSKDREHAFMMFGSASYFPHGLLDEVVISTK